jgi:hypothetical protein
VALWRKSGFQSSGIVKNPAIHQKSGRKFTKHRVKNGPTHFIQSCCADFLQQCGN